MFGTRGIRSLIVILAATGLSVSSQMPAYATALTITALSCEPEPTAVLCDGWVSGGTAPYVYTWNPATSHRTDFSNYSEATISCIPGSTLTVTFSVRDKLGATASKTIGVGCTGGHQ